MRRRSFLLALVVVASLAACDGGSADEPTATTTSSAVTQAAATTALEALCEMGSATDVEDARAAFYDRAHATLHAIAEAASDREAGSDAELLIAKQRVEALLEAPSLAPAFADDVRALRLVAARTVGDIGLETPRCGA